MTFKVPILLIAYNRPSCISRVIENLKNLKPTKLYIACDGPNESIENNKNVYLTRKIIKENVNWETKLRTKFNNKNQGCKYGVSNAISWFFKNENEGIILEDDILPHVDFFSFCEVLLEKYRNDKRVWCITGSNHVGENIGDGSYFFSRYNHCWGWASWRRCWDQYNVEMELWPKYKSMQLLKTNFTDKKEYSYWYKFFDSFYKNGSRGTWDYQWFFTSLVNNGLTITPNANLIENIGFGPDATHTKVGKSTSKKLSFDKDSGVIPIVHPTFLMRSSYADMIVEIKNFSGPYLFSFDWLKKYYLKGYRRIYKLLKFVLKQE